MLWKMVQDTLTQNTLIIIMDSSYKVQIVFAKRNPGVLAHAIIFIGKGCVELENETYNYRWRVSPGKRTRNKI